MKHIWQKIKINNYTYLFFLMCFFCGYIKNITIIFFICLIHELGHIIIIKLFKYEIIAINILPFGGYTLINKKINCSIKKDILISMGGIINQIIFYFIIIIFKKNLNLITYNLFIYYNNVLIIFNLLPIIPLDGNYIIHYLLDMFFPFQKAYFINYFISITSLLIYIIINIYLKIDNYFIIIFLFYKLIIDIKNYKYIKIKFLIERCFNNIEFKKINNHTNNIADLRREVYHFFRHGNKYINEKDYIKYYLGSIER